MHLCVLQASEAAKFLRQRSDGIALQLEHAATSLSQTDFESAMDSSALKLVTTVAAIKIQLRHRVKLAKKRVAERKAALAAREEGGGEG